MQVNPALLGIVERYVAALLARDDVNASRCAVGLVTCAAQLIGDDAGDRRILIAALRSIADDLESARRIIH
jgi:hypothetical protein